MARARKTVDKNTLAALLSSDNDPEAIVAALKDAIGVANVARRPSEAPATLSGKRAAAVTRSETKRQPISKRKLATPRSVFFEEGNKPGYINVYFYAETEAFEDGTPSTAGYSKGSPEYTALMSSGFRWTGRFGRWYGMEAMLPEFLKG